MKKFLTGFSVYLLLMLGVVQVDAATLSIGDDTTTAGASNKSVTVELQDSDLSDYVKVEFQLSVSGTTYAEIDFERKSSSLNFSVSGETYTFEAPKDSDGNYTGTLSAATIGAVSYKTTENLISDFKIVPTNVKFYKTDSSSYTTGDAGIKIDEGVIKYEKPKSNDATLTSLTVNQGTLSPEFSSETTEYKVTVKDTINTIKISATPATGASKTGTGNQTLVMGENKFEIVVTAEDGTTKKTYTVIVNRGETSEPSAYLKDLKINNVGCVLSPEFDKQNNKYTVEVASDIKSLDLEYELEDENATISIEGNEDFIVGKNVIKITIKSSDEKEEQVYELTVNVSETESKETPIEDNNKDDETKEKDVKPWVIVLIIGGILVIIGGVAFLLFRKKKNNNNKPKGNAPLKEDEKVEESSALASDEVTEILKGELFDDEKTTTYDKNLFMDSAKEEDLEKTKEFNFRDFN